MFSLKLKLKKDKSTKHDEDIDLLHDFGEDYSFNDEDSEKQKSGKHVVLLAILVSIVIMVVIFLFAFNYFSGLEAKKEMENAGQIEMLAPHDKLNYYLLNGTIDEKKLSASKLIGHTMETGCSESYNTLQQVFSVEDLEYLQDYLTGKSCGTYVPADIVNISDDGKKASYLMRLSLTGVRYVITIKYYDNELTSFIVELYGHRDLTDSSINTGINEKTKEEYQTNARLIEAESEAKQYKDAYNELKNKVEELEAEKQELQNDIKSLQEQTQPNETSQ